MDRIVPMAGRCAVRGCTGQQKVFPLWEQGNVPEWLDRLQQERGKLTVTFPKSVGQIPMCFPAKPSAQANERTTVNGVLYPFGFGLSYTTFEYSNLSISPEKQRAAGNIEVSADIRNAGQMAGDEVVQLYLSDEVSSAIQFEKVLRGFERIRLEPGETKTVHFTLTPEDLQVLDRNMNWTVEPGWFKLMIGSSSVDDRLEGRFEIEPAGRLSNPYDATSLTR